MRSGMHGTSETLRLANLMALGAPLADSEVLIGMEAVAVGAPGYVCPLSGAMISAMSSAGEGLG